MGEEVIKKGFEVDPTNIYAFLIGLFLVIIVGESFVIRYLYTEVKTLNTFIREKMIASIEEVKKAIEILYRKN